MTNQSRPNLSWLTVVQDGEDDFVIGNGSSFVNVPEVGAELIKLLDGSRSIAQAGHVLGERLGTEVDALDFVQTVSDMAILDRPPVQHTQFEHLRPKHVSWLFSWPSYCVVALLVASALITFLAHPDYFPTYSAILWTHSVSISMVTFLIVTWASVFLHEMSHVAAARSLNIPARISIGTRLQFLVAQTDVTHVWELKRQQRYRVYLAGLFTDIAIFGLAGSLMGLLHQVVIVRFLRVLLLIKLSQIAWQFLFFMRTDIYYAVANFLGKKNLLDDATNYLRRRSSRRPRTTETDHATRVYAWFVVIGRVGGFAFLGGYTIPLTWTLVSHCIGILRSGPAGFGNVADALVSLTVLAVGWGLFFITFVRRQIENRRTHNLQHSL